ncbi:MAG: chemotaxis protein CheD [Acidobacteria bacterium]|nr:chemotaxis protein CheD [Acidobacteriota bacterium]
MPNLLTVGVGDCQVSNTSGVSLVTYALGSCIAVVIHDPIAAVGGMLHFMLPDSALNPARASQNPFMFADSGIPLLFRTAYQLGAQKHRIIVRAIGGAQVMDDHGVFNIGKRNYIALRKILWKAGVMIHGEEVGGNESRTVRLEVPSGRVWIHGAGAKDRELLASSGKSCAPVGGGGS